MKRLTVDEVNNTIDLLKEDSIGTTRWISLGTIADKDFALVMSYVQYDEDELELCAKIAYNDSYMKEYDMDWIMPYNPRTGEVWDTEASVGDEVSSADVEWWNSEFEDMIPLLESGELQ